MHAARRVLQSILNRLPTWIVNSGVCAHPRCEGRSLPIGLAGSSQRLIQQVVHGVKLLFDVADRCVAQGSVGGA